MRRDEILYFLEDRLIIGFGLEWLDIHI